MFEKDSVVSKNSCYVRRLKELNRWFFVVAVMIGNDTFYWKDLDAKKCEQMNGTRIGSGCDTPVYIPNVFFFSCLIFLGTFALSMSLKMFRNTRFFPNKVCF